MALFTNGNGSIDKALERLKSLQSARAKAIAQDVEDRGRLATLRASQANIELDAMLGVEGKEAATIRTQIAELEQSIVGRALAMPGLLARIRAAILDLGKARAEAPRKAAENKRQKYDAHVARVAELQKSIEDASGAPWAQQMHHMPPPGTAFVANELRPVISKADVLAGELRQLQAEAARIEGQATAAVTEGGRVTGSTLEELLAVAEDPERLAPTIAEIKAWHKQAAARVDLDWARTLADHPGAAKRRTLFTIRWTADGSIDPAGSSAVNSVVSPFEDGSADRAHQQYVWGHRLSGGVGAGAMQERPRI